MSKIDILLATYNGERHIKAQILSILSQDYENWNLIIHDDGSSDNTINVIKEFIKIDKRIVLVEDNIKFGNPGNNFLHLLKKSTANYIMFCDQDDIWFDNKLSFMINGIKNKDNSIPTVVYSNSYVWHPQKTISGLSTFTFPKDLKSFLFLNSGMQGCVSIFNNKMKEELLKWNIDCTMHDHILHLIGLSFGHVYYYNIPLMLYRQHNNNVTGETHTGFFKIATLRRNTLPVVSKKHYNDIAYFLNIYKEILPQESIIILSKYLQLPYMNRFIRFFKIAYNGFKLYDSRIILLSKLILRPYIK